MDKKRKAQEKEELKKRKAQDEQEKARKTTSKKLDRAQHLQQKKESRSSTVRMLMLAKRHTSSERLQAVVRGRGARRHGGRFRVHFATDGAWSGQQTS